MSHTISHSQLVQALKYATEAALQAGIMLREEWHLPNGPHGSGGHAEIDEPVENMIRGQLLSAFPEWGFQGEETTPDTFPAGKPYWCVDPNDGTIEYLKGVRGSSVSIGLIHNGMPILGVIYSPLAPDDDGDLFTWCEGELPLRNGKPLPQLTGDVSRENQVMLAALNAEKKYRVNLSLIGTARFRSTNSIAYRFALTAAGEGDIGVSINNPKSWDIAGGHAILRGVGGIVCSEHLKPIEYSERGELRNHGRWLFGGHPAIIPAYSDIHWDDIFKVRPDVTGTENPPFPVRLTRGIHFHSDTSILQRAQGSLLGQMAGDALGAAVEFMTPEQITKVYPVNYPLTMKSGAVWNTIAGQFTDDTELAMMLARSIVASGNYDPESAITNYAWWYNSHPFDIGNTIHNALSVASNVHSGIVQTAMIAAQCNLSSEANGALMRIAPLAVHCYKTHTDQIAEQAIADAQLTHASPVCTSANAVFTIAAAIAIRTGDNQKAYQTALEWAKNHANTRVTGALIEAQSNPPSDFLSQPGWVIIALQNAFYHFLNTESFEKAIEVTIRKGGDTDTNAAICGALMGALYSREAVPQQWRKMLLSCHPVSGFSHIKQPRPPVLWGVDIYDLAERLLVTGS